MHLHMYSHSLCPVDSSASAFLISFLRRTRSDSHLVLSGTVMNAEHAPPVSKPSERLWKYIPVCAFAPVCSVTAPLSELDYLGQKLAAMETPQQLVCQFYRRECEYVGYILTLHVCVEG